MKKIYSIIIVIILSFSGLIFPANSEKIGITISQVSIYDEYDMIIISPDSYSSFLHSFIDHKNTRGVTTTLKTTEDIYSQYEGRDNPEKIKYFIKDAVESWNITYVLLVGSSAQLPSRYTHIYFDYDYQDEWIFYLLQLRILRGLKR